MRKVLNKETRLLLFKAFLEEEGLVKQQIESYNELITKGLQKIVQDIGQLDIETRDRKYTIIFERVEVGRPELRRKSHETLEEPTPMEARLRNLTYEAPIYLHMKVVDESGVEYPVPRAVIGYIPVMVKSAICKLHDCSREELLKMGEDPLDPGGYFIINGSERCLVSLEDLVSNKILLEAKEGGELGAKMFSLATGFRVRIEAVMQKDGSIYIQVPRVAAKIPFVVLMKALGVERDADIAELVSTKPYIQDELEPSFEKAIGVRNQRQALIYIGNRVAPQQPLDYRLERANEVIDKNFLPHLGRTEADRIKKAVMLANAASKLIQLKLGLRKPDDKDHMANKRIKLASQLIASLFRMAFSKLCKDMKYQLEKTSIKKTIDYKHLDIAIRTNVISDTLKHAFATGSWTYGKVGVTQLLDRTNYMSALSHLRRTQSPLSRRQPNFEARDLHATHWGRLCPSETPEGANCGLVKNMAIMARVSREVDEEEVLEFLKKIGLVEIVKVEDGRLVFADRRLRDKGAEVYLNGLLVGYCKDPLKFVETIKKARRNGEISSEINVGYLKLDWPDGPHYEIYVNCDEGRLRRPLIVVENGKPRLTREHIEKLRKGEMTWKDLVQEGVIEYLDADEEENAYIALDEDQLTPEHTHLEIAPWAMFGVCAATIPYAEYNQSPRVSYQAAMIKQALGIPGINFPLRMDSRLHLLVYPQKPLVISKLSEFIGLHERPCGQNLVVAVISFEGYNMEDAIILNKASIERGLGRSISYRVYETACKHYIGSEADRIMRPDPTVRGYKGDKYYRLLEDDGIVAVEQEVPPETALIGKVSPPRFLAGYGSPFGGLKRPQLHDASVATRPFEGGTVDTIIITEDAEGDMVVKVRVREQRIPELGDKFASRYGQKGVVGMIVPPEDMPYTADGIVPDLIINPHAIPSRMTIGQFIESIAGKVAALLGIPIDGTPFEGTSVDDLREWLKKLGFQYSGREVMYDGMTGERMEADVFIGVVYYQKLHHMALDKLHARSRGQVQMLTRQPTEGRARGGGLRFGEMERDCLIGHGATALIKDRLLECSDKYLLYVCENCGSLAYHDNFKRKYICPLCGEEAKVAGVYVPYAFKLLLQELISMCLFPKIKLKEVGE